MPRCWFSRYLQKWDRWNLAGRAFGCGNFPDHLLQHEGGTNVSEAKLDYVRGFNAGDLATATDVVIDEIRKIIELLKGDWQVVTGDASLRTHPGGGGGGQWGSQASWIVGPACRTEYQARDTLVALNELFRLVAMLR